MDRSKQLGEDRILKLLVKFSVPAIVGMMVNALYNVVDRIFVGRGVGSLALAGITVGFPLMILQMAFSMLIGIGGNSLVSIRLGQGRKDEAKNILGNAFVLLIGISFILSVLGLLFINDMLRAFGASDAVLPFARAYLRIILFGGVFQSMGMGLNNFIRGEGNPKMAMNTMLIGAFLNTALDPLFIFVFKWGIEGAALATIISQAVSAIWVTHYLFSDKSSLKIQKKYLKLKVDIVKGIIAIGSAPFALQLAASLVTIILNNSLVFYGGDVAVAGMGIINTIAMMILMPVFGINQGSQPIIGFNYGAKKYDRVKLTLKYAIAAATSIILIGYTIVMFYPAALISMFNKNDLELIDFGSKAIKIFLVFMPIIGFQIVSSNYFQAVGKPKKSMLLSISRQVLFLIPALLILPRFFGLNGVIYAGPTSDLLSSIMTAIVLFYEMRHLDESHEAEELRLREV